MSARVAALPLGAALTLLGLVRSGRTDALDKALIRRLEGSRETPARRLLELSAQPGYPPLSRALPLAAVLSATHIGGRREGVFQGAAWGLASMGLLLKQAVKRPRPDDPVRRLISPDARGSSFPSTHVLTYILCYGYLARTARRRCQSVALRVGFPTFIVAMTLLASLNRIAEGEHWPSDVLAAMLLGVGALLLLDALERAAERRALVLLPATSASEPILGAAAPEGDLI